MLRSYSRFLRAVANSLLNSSDILERDFTDEEIAHATAELLDAKDEMLMHLCNLDFSAENTLAIINWIAYPAQSPRLRLRHDNVSKAYSRLESPSGKPVWWTDGYLRKDSYVLGYVRKNAIFEKFNAYIFSASNTMCNGYMEGFPSVSEARKFIESELD